MNVDKEIGALARLWEAEGDGEAIAYRLFRSYINVNLHEESKKLLPFLLKKRLERSPDWDEIKKLISLSPKEFNIVGGRVYRNLLEIVHEKDYRSNHVDWDLYHFSLMKQTDLSDRIAQHFEPKIRKHKADTVIPEYNNDSLKVVSKEKADLKIDIISAHDILSIQGASLPLKQLIANDWRIPIDRYLNETPLTIQAIIYNPSRGVLYSKDNFNSIYSKTTTVNNPQDGVSFQEYFSNKKIGDVKLSESVVPIKPYEPKWES